MTTLPPEANDGQGAENAAPASEPAAAPQYEAPPAGAQQVPPAAPQYQAAPAANPVSNIQLNYWLLVFFTWIPALIFYIIDKDKGDQRLRQLQTANLNFTLLRIGAIIVAYIFAIIPYIGWIIALLLWLGSLVLFVFHIIAATKVQQAYQSGQADPFIFNIPMVK